MMDYPILSILIWFPIIVGVALVAFNNLSKSTSSTIALVTTLLVLIISIQLLQYYDSDSINLQFVEKVQWIPGFNIFYYLAVDGISVSLIILTAFIIFLIVIFISLR